MSTYLKDDGTLADMAARLIAKFEPLKFIALAEIKIDFVWAFGARDEDGNLTGDAIKKNGLKALGLCRIISLKDRAKGHGDCEILIDKDWWDSVDDDQREAVLDHELTHIKLGKDADDLGRPKLKMRKHSFEFGWFSEVAARHGAASQEQIQAESILDQAGQFYWPELVKVADKESGSVTISTEGHQPVTMSNRRFSQIAKELGTK